jgi:hypothetical protein
MGSADQRAALDDLTGRQLRKRLREADPPTPAPRCGVRWGGHRVTTGRLILQAACCFCGETMPRGTLVDQFRQADVTHTRHARGQCDNPDVDRVAVDHRRRTPVMKGA